MASRKNNTRDYYVHNCSFLLCVRLTPQHQNQLEHVKRSPFLSLGDYYLLPFEGCLHYSVFNTIWSLYAVKWVKYSPLSFLSRVLSVFLAHGTFCTRSQHGENHHLTVWFSKSLLLKTFIHRDKANGLLWGCYVNCSFSVHKNMISLNTHLVIITNCEPRMFEMTVNLN